KAKDELAAIIKDIPEDLRDHAHILETHMVMFKDKMLYGKTIDTIEKEKVNAEWALKKTAADVREMFRDIADPYIKGRVTDIVHVSNRIMQQLMGTEKVDIGKIDKRVILVAHDLSPADTSQIQLDKIKGFVTDRGGRTSHTAIIARTLDIPSVLGLENATKVIHNDDIIIVDGENGIVIIHPTDESLIKYQNREQEYAAYKIDVAKSSHLPSRTVDGVTVKVLANIEMVAEIDQAREYGADGIGLFRTEFLYLSRKEFPTEEELFDEYRKVVEAMAPKSVTIRTLDINGDKAVAYDQTEDEANPALGLRAIRFCLKRPEVFQTQLRAILRASAFGNAKIMFPLISCYEELEQAREALEAAAGSLTKDGLAYSRNIEVGAMIEVPSTVIIADMLADLVDFFSIGTNDLVQYSLAIDRGNRQVAHLFQTFHPAVIRMIRQVIEVGKSKGVDVVMCGEMAGSPVNMPILLGLGMERLSMNPPVIPVIKNVIRAMKAEDARVFMDEVFKKTTAAQISDLVTRRFGDLFAAMPGITR
ncbi:MAG: phosphoenolpyruvate--protein phosphotransferase, partial [Thermodesulfobacteriota bacterium]